MDEFFYFVEKKVVKIFSGTCRYYVGKRYKCGWILLLFEKKKLVKLFSGTCRYYVGKRYKCDKKRDEKGRLQVLFPGTILVPFLTKKSSTNRCKNRCRKNMKIIVKGSQNRCEIDAKTHQKTMPELVSKKNKKTHQKSCFSEEWNHWNSLKNNCFDDLEGCMCER